MCSRRHSPVLFQGLKFGMVLQFAVGPICLMTLNASSLYGFMHGLCFLSSAACIDAFYIFLACLGISAILKNTKIKTTVQIFGCLILISFGISTILHAFGSGLLSSPVPLSDASCGNLFFQGLLLTASNPLTVIFWGSVFSAKIAEYAWCRKQIFLFAAGCVLSTVIFLTGIALLGSELREHISSSSIQIFNTAVGIFLIYSGITLFCKKNN